jgi:hypothetical protein
MQHVVTVLYPTRDQIWYGMSASGRRRHFELLLRRLHRSPSDSLERRHTATCLRRFTRPK